jgi:hypothetical protein
MLISESEEESPTARNAAYRAPGGAFPHGAPGGALTGPSDNSERTRSVRFNDAGCAALTTTEEATATGIESAAIREREEEAKSSRERRKEQGEGNGVEMV